MMREDADKRRGRKQSERGVEQSVYTCNRSIRPIVLYVASSRFVHRSNGGDLRGPKPVLVGGEVGITQLEVELEMRMSLGVPKEKSAFRREVFSHVRRIIHGAVLYPTSDKVVLMSVNADKARRTISGAAGVSGALPSAVRLRQTAACPRDRLYAAAGRVAAPADAAAPAPRRPWRPAGDAE